MCLTVAAFFFFSIFSILFLAIKKRKVGRSKQLDFYGTKKKKKRINATKRLQQNKCSAFNVIYCVEPVYVAFILFF